MQHDSHKAWRTSQNICSGQLQTGNIRIVCNRMHLGVEARGKADDHAHAQHQRSIAAVDGDLRLHHAVTVTSNSWALPTGRFADATE